MIIYPFTIGEFDVNNYLIHGDNSRRAILIDAGYDPSPICQKIEELNLELVYLINTHGHGDHIAGNQKILDFTGAKLLMHEADAAYLSNPNLNLSAFIGISLKSSKPDRLLKEGDRIELDGLFLEVLHTPGHTPGHITLVGDQCAFVGDVIFRESVGRTDFPGSSSQQLIESIRKKIYQLPDDMILYPGHGPRTTVAHEKLSNPFVSY
ncbi:MAG: MBL fold metallo-hydrolase [Calditrichaeota bacterium]|nr:MBL fold metallo-hydrolase [Calditrichota bacterium]RQV99192.1 MAG: MBL fold metallo-hydrolase [Calditrichota bacterium]